MSSLENTVLQLFTIRRKSDLRKHCRSQGILGIDLSNVILACEAGELPWRHKIRYRDFIPQHLELTEDDKKAMLSSDLKSGSIIPPYLRKLTRIFSERRYLVGHLFYTIDLTNWHLLYFDQRDTAQRSNHWKEGSHIHLINCLCVQTDVQTVWDEFNSGNPQIRGSIHIRWADNIERGPFGPESID
jgi:hypothetical protein